MQPSHWQCTNTQKSFAWNGHNLTGSWKRVLLQEKRDRDDFQENWTLEQSPFDLFWKEAACRKKATGGKAAIAYNINQYHWFKKRQLLKGQKRACWQSPSAPAFSGRKQSLPGFYLHLGGVETRWSHSTADGLFVGHDPHHWAGDLGALGRGVRE